MEGTAMRWIVRMIVPACFLLTVVLSSGCNVLSVPFYLFGPEDKIKPTMQSLTPSDKHKDVKVLIWTWSDRSTFDLEISSADRKLAQKLEERLRGYYVNNKASVSVVPFRRVEQYRNGREDTSPVEAGKHFKADYVIYLEVSQFSISDKNSMDQLLKGRAQMRVSLYDLAKGDEEPTKSDLFECTFPPESKGGMVVNDMGNSKQMFAQSFLNYVSRELSWMFTDHTQDEDEQVH
jgi:hypothetical protein